MTGTLREALGAERVRAERVISTGLVKQFSAEGGYGFISPDEGDDDLLVRSTSTVHRGFETLTVGARVEFEVNEGQRGLEAFDVVAV